MSVSAVKNISRTDQKFLEFFALKAPDEMQSFLNLVFKESGIEKAMDLLFQWELKTGYITQAKLTDNEILEFFSSDYQVNFKIQINKARSNYKPVPLQGKNIPDLYSPITIENVGIPGKENLRVFQFPLDGKKRQFFLQATPFPLFWNHFVLINLEKVPQKIDSQTTKDLFDFLNLAPNYTICSNSDLEWTGASILKHMHYQVFEGLILPVMRARNNSSYTYNISNATIISALDFPCGVIKVIGPDPDHVKKIMDTTIKAWMDEDRTRNSVNLIVTLRNNLYEGYIFFRNSNYRTPENLLRIKSEGVGIIEMAGEGIFPVPSGDDAEIIENEIRSNGLSVLQRIIEGNNPIKNRSFFKSFIQKLNLSQ